MPVEIVTVPCLSDNYAFLVHESETGKTALVDVPEFEPISKELSSRSWDLTHVLLTHHHNDHVDGLFELLEAFPAKVVGAKSDAHRLPELNLAVEEGDLFSIGKVAVSVIDVPGHTSGHVAYYLPDAHAVFTADSLMALGCGRLFEGSPNQMLQSLKKIANLPPETQIYSGHEYTYANGRFAVSIEPENIMLRRRCQDAALASNANQPTIPSTLRLELETNPFLRCGEANVQSAVGLEGADQDVIFAELRKRRDAF